MFLFFHINAVGMPKKWNRPASDTFFWPRMVQLAWQQYNKVGEIQNTENFIIKPEGFEIPYDSERFHKISTDRAIEEGTPLKEVLEKFSKMIDESEYLIAHNMNLAANVVEAEFYRKSMNSRMMASERFSLMQEATYFCRIKGPGGKFKWPTIQELYMKCYNSHFEEAHDASVVAQAVADCFFLLVKKGELDLFE